MSELLEIDHEITGKHTEQTVRIALLQRLMALADEHPTPVIIDVLVRALEREVWRMQPRQRETEYLNMLVDAINRLQFSYTRVWRDTPPNEVQTACERADRLETALADASFTDEQLIQVLFNEVKGLPFEELDPRWDVLHARFPDMSPTLKFAAAYAVCVHCTTDARHPIFMEAVGLIADAALNNDDKAKLADALVALHAAQSMHAQLHSA